MNCNHVFRDSTRCLHCGVTELALLRSERAESLKLLGEMRQKLEQSESWGKDVKTANDGLAEEHVRLTRELDAVRGSLDECRKERGELADRVTSLEARRQ